MTDVSNSVRLGIFRDRLVLSHSRSSFGSLVVPAHIAAYSPDGLWGFLSGVGSGPEGPCSFWYDPMTYYVGLDTQYWFRGSETRQGPMGTLPAEDDSLIRPSFRALLDSYGLLGAVLTTDLAGVRELLLTEGTTRCLSFQRSGVGPKTERAVAKYAELLDVDLQDQAYYPDRLVAPYVALDSWNGQSASDQARLNRHALDIAGSYETWAVLALDMRSPLHLPTTEERSALLLHSFAGVGLWVSGLDEYEAPLAQLEAYARLISTLAQPVWVMYGGYFALLCAELGVCDVSHGVYYTESKKLRGPVGSGPPAERYYIPQLHRFFEPGRALDLIHRNPGLRCQCPECPSLDALQAELLLASRSSDRRMAWAARLQRHFLAARADEVESVRTVSRAELMQELRSTIDRMITSGLSAYDPRTTGHLASWVEVLSRL